MTPKEKLLAALDAGDKVTVLNIFDSMAETNRGLHRRAQAHESEMAAFLRETGVHKARRTSRMWAKAWKSEFDRLMRGHQEVKAIYEVCAKVLGLPYGLYNSVGDLPHGRGSDGGLYANVLLSRQGGVEVFNVREVVQQLADRVDTPAN